MPRQTRISSRLTRQTASSGPVPRSVPASTSIIAIALLTTTVVLAAGSGPIGSSAAGDPAVPGRAAGGGGGGSVEPRFGPVPGPGSLVLVPEPAGTRITYASPDGAVATLRETAAFVSEQRLVAVPDAGVYFAAWDETAADIAEHRVSVSLDAGASWSRPQALTYDIPLKAGRLSPGGAPLPIPEDLRAGSGDRLFVVQFETVGLEAWRRILGSLGAEVLTYIPEHGEIVRMDPALVPLVSGQPFVRWVGPYHPGYRIEPEVLDEIAGQSASRLPRRYHLQTFTSGPVEKGILADEVRAIGGRIDAQIPNGYLLDATLSLDQVVKIARSEHLLWLDRWSPPGNDMDIVRENDGANYIESLKGYSGQGVNGEVMDCGFMQNHQDFDGVGLHDPSPTTCDHGTCTYGIVFGNGNRDGDGSAMATGNLPSAHGWFYDYNHLTDRYQETAELVQSPIFAVFQSNSWGDAQTTAYTSVSAQMDDIIYLNDISIFQSQSNLGNQSSRPQAWAKNIISIGGADHFNTLTLSDDCWCNTASIGPAEDGRIKPDLLYWYDWIFTTDLDPGGYASGLYYDNFGGTSAATPISAGVAGLFFQMWADNILGNSPQGSTVFEKRPHSSTMKALLINTAQQYPFSGTTADLTRMHQGWGLPSAKQFYDRAPLIKVVDEENVLLPLDTHSYTATVPPGQGELKVTMVYTDRAGTTSSTQDRINDVTLKVIDPTGATTWWGNHGLDAGNWSTPGGSADTKNTVENVFIQNPAAGDWTIEVSGDEINQDEHAETPEVDQDYALVVYGVNALTLGCAVPPPAPTAETAVPDGDDRVDISWTGTATARRYRVYRSLGGCAGTYTLVGTVPNTQTTFTDLGVSGGSTYGYVVRAVESCESANSNCAAATASGPCTLAPSFAGIASASGNNASTCGASLSWPAATPSCGGPVRYNVYRSTSSGFTPSPSNRIASCLSATSYVDTRNLQTNTTYNYIVRAEDIGGRGGSTCNGAPETNTISKSAVVQGGTGVLLDTGFETGFEGWIASLGTPAASAGDWVQGTPTASSDNGQTAQPGTCASGTKCLFTGVNHGGNPNNGDVDGGEVVATSPVINASGFATAHLTLSRWHYNGATSNDNGDRFAIDVSNDNGASWGNLETLGPLTSVNSWTPVAFNLQTVRPLTSQMKLRVRSADGPTIDSVVESAIDAVHIDGAMNCSTQTSAAPGDVPQNSLQIAKSASKLQITWSPECGGGVGYGLYRGDLSVGYASLAPLSGLCGIGTTTVLVDPGPGSYFFLLAPNDGTVEGSLGKKSDGTPRPQPAQVCFPRAAPVNACAP